MAHLKGGNAADDEDDLARVEDGLGGVDEVEIDALGEADIGEVERGSADVFEFEVFEEVIVVEPGGDLGRGGIGGVIHDFGDDKATEVVGDIWQGGGKLERGGPMAPAAGVILVADAGAVGRARADGGGGNAEGACE